MSRWKAAKLTEKLWGNRDFALWLTGTTADSLGMSAVELAIPLSAFTIGGTTSFAGMMGTVYAAVFASVVLIGGTMTDQFDRRIGMIIRSVSGFVFWALVGVMLATQTMSIVSFFALLVLAALSAGLFGSADNAALRSIVPDSLIVEAQGPIQARNAIVQLAGAPLGGLLYGLAPSLPFLLAASCGAVLAACAMTIRTDLHPPAQAPTKGVDRTKLSDYPRQMAAGIRFCTGDSAILHAIIVVMIVNLCTSMILQISMLRFLGLGYTPSALSLIFLGATAMMLVSSVLIPFVVTRVRGGALLVSSLHVMAVSFVVTALFPSYWLILVSLGIVGVVIPLQSAILQGYVAIRTPHSLQGRVSSLLTLASLGVNAVTPVASGVIVETGLSRAGYAGSAMLITLIAIATAVWGPLRKLPRAGRSTT